MVTDISGKKILFFSPAFFKYENMIADKMREMGAEVDMYDVRSVTGAFQRALLKISPAIFKRHSVRYYEDIIEKNRDKNYDYILIVKCDMTPASILEKFRVVYPNAKLCLNLWDSVENIPGVTKKFKYFDTLHSFDLNDCEKYPVLKFRPLFFGDQFRKESHTGDYKYDISFLGTVHSDRYAVIKQVQKIAVEKGLKCFWFLYLQSRFIYKFSIHNHHVITIEEIVFPNTLICGNQFLIHSYQLDSSHSKTGLLWMLDIQYNLRIIHNR